MDDEEKLQRAFSVKTSKLELAFQAEGVKIMDLSAIPQFETDLINSDKDLCIEFNNGFVSWLLETSPAQVYYTEQTHIEITRRLDGLISKARYFEGISRTIFGQPRLDAIKRSRLYNDLAMRYLELIRDNVEVNIAETIIPEEIGSELDKPILKNIHCALIEVAATPGVIRDISSRYRATKKSGNRGKTDYSKIYDPKILAKAIGVSYSQNVNLITSDRDFVRMNRNLLERRRYYESKYGINLTANTVNIFNTHRKGLVLHRNGSEKVILSGEVEYGLEDTVARTTFG